MNNQKRIFSIVAVLVVVCVANQAQTEKSDLSATVRSLQTQLDHATEPPDVVSPPDVDLATWQVFTDAAKTYSFRYPKDWTVYEFPDTTQKIPMPKSYLATFLSDTNLLGKGTPVPLMITCSVDTTSVAQYVQEKKNLIKNEMTKDGRPSIRDFQDYTLESGTVTTYYFEQSLYTPLQQFITAKNGTFCFLQLMRPAESPLTKAEDGIAFKILNTFTFTK